MGAAICWLRWPACEDSGKTNRPFPNSTEPKAPTALENWAVSFSCHLRPPATPSELLWMGCLQGTFPDLISSSALSQSPPAVCEWTVCSVYCAWTFNRILTAAWVPNSPGRHRVSASAPLHSVSPTYLVICPEVRIMEEWLTLSMR